MSQSSIDNTFTQRLACLERESRNLKRLVMVLCLGIGFVVLTAQAPGVNRTLEAERFVVKDTTGKIRAVLGVGAVFGEGENAVGLQLLARDGTTRLQSFVRSDESPFFQLRDQKGNVSAQLDLSASGHPGILLFAPRSGPNSRSEITASFGLDDLPYIQLRDKNDKIMWRTPSKPGGTR